MRRDTGSFLYVTTSLEQDPEAVRRAWEQFRELCLKHGKRGVVAVEADAELERLEAAAEAAELPCLRGEAEQTPDGYRYRVVHPQWQPPFERGGWPVLALGVSPQFFVELSEDRGTLAIVYVPRTEAEQRHLQLATDDAVGI